MDRIAISASSWASQSTALRVNARFSGAEWTKRSVGEVEAAHNYQSAAGSLGGVRRRDHGGEQPGLEVVLGEVLARRTEVMAVNAPPARLETKAG